MNMKVIAAVDAKWGIGYRGKLLVSIPADMRFFRDTTTGHTVVMGRKTLESFPGSKPLPHRNNIVLTSRADSVSQAQNLKTVAGLKELSELLASDPAYSEGDIYCIGGESVYRLLLPYCDTAYITKIDHVYEADAHFPDLDADPEWRIESESEEQTYFDLTYSFVTYRRIDKAAALIL